MRTSWLFGAAVIACSLGACGKKQAGNGVIDASPLAIDATVDASPKILPDGAVALCTPTSGTTLDTETLATGLDSPIWVGAPVGDRRLFVIEQPGRLRIIEDGTLRATPFLDLTSDKGGPVDNGGNEEGLLGLAFHPDYAHNGRFYVRYTKADYSVEVAEYTVSADPYVASPTSARVLITVAHPSQQNHNSGTIEFGPDGYLYFSLGDGGGGGDPNDNAQNTTRLPGKFLRLDVDTRTGSKAYGIPATNPFASSADDTGAPRPEIWNYGWRNPYRWDFDRTTGDLIVGDVGQDLVEEVDIVPSGTGTGENFGWHVWEADSCFAAPCGDTGFHKPAVTHPHTDGWCAVIGGGVYRGACYPDLVGQYFYTDYCKHQLWSFTPTAGAAVNDRQLTIADFPSSPTSIHADALGELYVTSRDGTVRHIIAKP